MIDWHTALLAAVTLNTMINCLRLYLEFKNERN